MATLYTLKKGDRLEKLAAEHGIALARLRQVNSISPKTRVGPGFELLLPRKGAAVEPLPTLYAPPPVPERPARAESSADRTVTRQVTHTVARGETLATIAERYKVSLDDLKRWNKVGRLAAGQKLQVEQTVTIPAARKAPVRQPAARKATPRKPAQATRTPARSSAAAKPAARTASR